MGKQVYSLVLNDEVVAAVDALAAQRGYSRSALVNHVLAEFANVTSPQKRASQIFEAIQQAVEGGGLRPFAQSGESLTLRTALSYKYNPALSYTVELRENSLKSGQLRVVLRSQNEDVLTYFKQFLDIWDALEKKHLMSYLINQGQTLGPKRYQRTLRFSALQLENNEIGRLVANYIGLMDGCLKVFFQNIDDTARASKEAELEYVSRLLADENLSKL